MKIRMKGVVVGRHTTEVEVYGTGKNLTFLFDGVENRVLKDYLMFLLKKRAVVAGTYAPEKWYDGINVYNTLVYRFFEDKVEVLEASGIGEMPYEEGVIY